MGAPDALPAPRLDWKAIADLFRDGWLPGEIALHLGYNVHSVRSAINRQQLAGKLPYRASQTYECDQAFWIRHAAARGMAPCALQSRVLQICEQGLLEAILDDGVKA